MTSVHRAGQPILVGVDGSESALRAVRWAAREATFRGTGLRLVHAFGWANTADRGDLGMDYRDVLLRIARERMAAAVAQVPPRIDVIADLLEDHPIPQLLAESRRAQLVVVGDRGLGGLADLLIGSIAVALAAHADCPVVVVRGEEQGSVPGSDRPVVVGIDGLPTSGAALAFAFDAAAARRVPLVAVHTWLDVIVEPMCASVDWAVIEAGERQLLAERVAEWGGKFPDVPVERVVTWDRPARMLVERSVEAQLVVVGSRGRSAFAGLVLGSVSHAVLHRAKCPVAVVRPALPPRS